MLFLFDSNDNKIQFTEAFNMVDRNISPIKEIISKSDLTNLSISVDEENKIALNDVFTLLVNVKESGSIYALFNKENLNKEEIISKLQELKKIKVVDLESAKNKTKEALKILDEYHPYIYLYVEKRDYPLSMDELKEVYEGQLTFLYAPKVVDEEETPKEEEGKIYIEKKKFSIKEFVKPIKKYKYHFMFLSISTLLIGFALSLAIFNSMLAKGIAALFYICAFIGAFLNTYIYFDYFKKNTFKDKLFIYSICFNTLGLLISALLYLGYNAIDKTEGKENLSMGLIIGMSILATIIITMLSIGLAFLIRKSKKKKK